MWLIGPSSLSIRLLLIRAGLVTVVEGVAPVEAASPEGGAASRDAIAASVEALACIALVERIALLVVVDPKFD